MRKNEERYYIKQKHLKLALRLLEELEKPLEVLHFLMQRDEIGDLVIVLLSAPGGFDLKRMLEEQKRESDLMFELLPEENLYAVLCQNTDIEGGFQMAKRLKRHLDLAQQESIIVELEIHKSVHYESKDILFKLFDLYVDAYDAKKNEIVFYSLH